VEFCFLVPLVGFSRFAAAVESDNTVALGNRIDFNRLGRSLAPRTYLEKRSLECLGRIVSSWLAGASASLADPVLGELATPQALRRIERA
jgi:Protein of unknown function (DUF2939)